MHLKVDGHALIAGLATLRNRRKLPPARIQACPQSMGKLADVRCGDVAFQVPVFDRRCWSDTVEFDGKLLGDLLKIPADDLFMDICRVEYIAGRIVFAENLTAPAKIVPSEEG